MKAKALFGLWSEMKVPDINRILKPCGVRLVMKRSKDWGKSVSVTAHPVETAKRVRAPRETPKPAEPLVVAPAETPPSPGDYGGKLPEQPPPFIE